MDGQHILPKRWPTLEQLTAAAETIPEIDPLAVFTLNQLLAATRDVEAALDKDMGQYGLSMGRYVTLWAIAERQSKGVTPAELADSLGVTRATMTGLLDGLEKDALIKRTRRKDDRRKVNISLKEQGAQLLAQMYPDHIERCSQAMRFLSEREKKQFVRLLKKVVDGTPAFLEPSNTPPSHPSKKRMTKLLDSGVVPGSKN